MYKKFVNMTQVLAEVWGPNKKQPRSQDLCTFSAKELVFTFLPPQSLYALKIISTVLPEAVACAIAFFGPDAMKHGIEVFTTGAAGCAVAPLFVLRICTFSYYYCNYLTIALHVFLVDTTHTQTHTHSHIYVCTHTHPYCNV